MLVRASGPRSPRHRATPWTLLLSGVLLPVLAAVALGALVSHDALFGIHHPFWTSTLELGHARSYLWSASAIALLAVMLYFLAKAPGLYANRYRVAIVLLVTSPAITGFNIGRLDPTDIVAMIGSVFWFATMLGEDRPIQVQRRVLAVLAIIGLAAVASAHNGGIGALLSAPAVALKLLFMFLLCDLIRLVRDHEFAMRMIVYVAAFSAFVALASQLIYQVTGLALTLDDRLDEWFKCFGGFCVLRASGLTPSPQALGHLLIMGISLALFMPCKLRPRILLLGVLVVGAGLTFSYGVLLAIGIILVAYPLVRWPRAYPLILLGYAMAGWLLHVTGIVAATYSYVVTHLLGAAGVNARVWTYRAALEHIVDHPLIGSGALRAIPGSLHFNLAHNAYMQIAFELGLIAAAAFTALGLYVTYAAIRAAIVTTCADTRRWLTGLATGLIGMQIHFMSEPLYTNHIPWIFMGVGCCAVVLYDRRKRSAPAPQPT